MNAPSILIVEDELIIAEDIKHQLESAGYSIAGIVNTGEAAIEYVDSQEPQLVLMDIKLAGDMDGIEATRALQEQHDVPVVYLTANKDLSTISKAKHTEPYGYIGKPFNFLDMRSVIELALHKHKMDAIVRDHEHWLEITLNNVSDGVITLNENLKVVYLNPVAEKLTGFAAKKATGKDFLKVFKLHDLEKEGQAKEFKSQISGIGKEPAHGVYFLESSKNKLVPVEVVAAPAWNQSGDFFGIVIAFNDISERAQAETEKQRLVDSLIRKNGDLEQILYIISHDLRTPLISIKGFSGILERANERAVESLKDGYATSEVKKAVEPILTYEIPEALVYLNLSTYKMESLLSSLLELSRVGLTQIRIEDLDMYSMAHTMLDGRQYQIGEAGASVKVDDLPTCRGDASQISLVLSNLLDNALKFLNPDRPGKIKITGKKKGKMSEYCIEDNGIGIDPEHQGSIFRLFHRLQAKEIPGEGLGLTIVSRVIDRHEGKIWVESEPGKGSKFYFTLPAD